MCPLPALSPPAPSHPFRCSWLCLYPLVALTCAQGSLRKVLPTHQFQQTSPALIRPALRDILNATTILLDFSNVFDFVIFSPCLCLISLTIPSSPSVVPCPPYNSKFKFHFAGRFYHTHGSYNHFEDDNDPWLLTPSQSSPWASYLLYRIANKIPPVP